MPQPSLRALYFPYCLRRLDDGSWIILNRNYRPVGHGGSSYPDHEGIHPNFRIPNLTNSQIRALSHTGEADGNDVYLYNDGCVPTNGVRHMDDYLRRLRTLMWISLKGENAS